MFKPNKEQVHARFGVDPETIGYKDHSWWIACVYDALDEGVVRGVQHGDLCVRVQERGEYEIDVSAIRRPNFRAVQWSKSDPTYRFYYFSPLCRAQLGPDTQRRVFAAIEREMNRQHEAYRSMEDAELWIADYARIARQHLETARDAVMLRSQVGTALREVLQAAAVLIECLEVYGVPEEREIGSTTDSWGRTGPQRYS